ncbi:hypothetical protein [Herbiconiux sp. VKM Ac-2851]|uniref:hypothetical protein n=1 Tax=Herbiconiux sp. VKM Ac-2851 TaxID=2739025 RepID=UPI0015648A18|nr:hypothetical protein [Herbiconiux sp. VKM Ac-2851]NQX37141.1 hypothetical protein [Herbiconiux sp. VKM Ac-2851]
MKHITFAEKSLLVGDDAAEAITEYAAALAKHASADTVTLSAFGSDGQDVNATFVLDSGTVLMAETTHSSIPEPDNTDAVAYMREKTRLLVSPPSAGPHDQMPSSPEDDRYFDEL